MVVLLVAVWLLVLAGKSLRRSQARLHQVAGAVFLLVALVLSVGGDRICYLLLERVSGPLVAHKAKAPASVGRGFFVSL